MCLYIIILVFIGIYLAFVYSQTLDRINDKLADIEILRRQLQFEARGIQNYNSNIVAMGREIADLKIRIISLEFKVKELEEEKKSVNN